MRDPFDDGEDRDWYADEGDGDEMEADSGRPWDLPEEPEEDGLTFGGMPLPLIWDMMNGNWPGE